MFKLNRYWFVRLILFCRYKHHFNHKSGHLLHCILCWWIGAEDGDLNWIVVVQIFGDCESVLSGAVYLDGAWTREDWSLEGKKGLGSFRCTCIMYYVLYENQMIILDVGRRSVKHVKEHGENMKCGKLGWDRGRIRIITLPNSNWLITLTKDKNVFSLLTAAA